MNENSFNYVIAENIKIVLKRCGYTQKEVAELLGMSQTLFTEKLNGHKKFFTVYELKIIADEFYVTIDELTKI